jgi:hypothetical protein
VVRSGEGELQSIHATKISVLRLGGQLKTGNLWTAQTGNFAGGRDQ